MGRRDWAANQTAAPAPHLSVYSNTVEIRNNIRPIRLWLEGVLAESGLNKNVNSTYPDELFIGVLSLVLAYNDDAVVQTNYLHIGLRIPVLEVFSMTAHKWAML